MTNTIINSPVIFEELKTADGFLIGVATINSEKSLNALTLDIITLLLNHFTHWQENPDIVCLILQGSGSKAFCAGGDIHQLYNSIQEHGCDGNPYAETFFEQEYRLDYLIHTYNKPIICWAHGIVMGGGLGLMCGASHRVVTERSKIAYPEINIGLYPDVGGSWVLNRMPWRTGLYLGLTGSVINANDAIFLGLADRTIENSEKERVVETLLKQSWDNSLQHHQNVSDTLRRYETLKSFPEGNLINHLDYISRVTDAESLEEILENIFNSETDDQWINKGSDALKKGCPITAHLIYEQIRRGKHMSLKDIFMMELVISTQCTRHLDFPEGVRAVIIDKDHSPNWCYESTSDVPKEIIEKHFTSPWKSNPLADL